MNVSSLCGMIAAVARAAESLVPERVQKAVQARCEDLTLRVGEIHPLSWIDKATGRLFRVTVIGGAAALLVAQLAGQMCGQAPKTGGLAGVAVAAALLIFAPALGAMAAWGQRLTDWVDAGGDFQRSNGRLLGFLCGSAMVATASWFMGQALLDAAVRLAPLAPAASWGAFLLGLAHWFVPAAALGLWMVVTCYAYATWATRIALHAAQFLVRRFEWLMWKIVEGPKGAVAAIAAIVSAVATAAQAALSGR